MKETPQQIMIKILESGVPKKEACEMIEEIIEERLSKVGIDSISHLSDAGAVFTLSYLYGCGIIDADTVNSFLSSPIRAKVDEFGIGLKPGEEDEDTVFYLDVRYTNKEKNSQFNPEDN